MKLMTIFRAITLTIFTLFSTSIISQNSTNNPYQSIHPGKLWFDDSEKLINAHGGGILFHNDTYYWYGEHKSEHTSSALVGVTCYSSKDLYNWKNEGVALSVVHDNEQSPITIGSVIERPKVIYNTKNKQFVMYFHLELKDRGYEAAHVAVAVSDTPAGPFKLVKNSRVNAGKWPMNMSAEQINSKEQASDYKEWWTAEWTAAIKDGLFVRRDFKDGQMSRDMTLFVDDDQKAYHIYSSEDNLTLQIAELTDDYLDYTGRYIRIEPAGHNEAPAIFKKDGKYFMITSGCTGWDPNAARLLVSDDILGEWKLLPNPCRGRDAHLTFHSQSTYILPVQGKKDAFIFMADRWKPQNPIDARYIWLPILFDEQGLPYLKWMDNWDLNIFDQISADKGNPQNYEGWKLVWNDEFDTDGKPNSKIWSYEKGLVRNEEAQWYSAENTNCRNGILYITARKEQVINDQYTPGSNDWRKKNEYAQYTSASINTRGTKEFQYGRFEIRAKIPTAGGAWPAIWTLGKSMEWPSNGEIDIMEYYRIDGKPHILANAAWGTDKRFDAKWNSSAKPFLHFLRKDTNWADKFHIWKMDWDKDSIKLYLDDELLNEIFLDETTNGKLGKYKNPFKQPHYLLLNLAIGGINGGTPDDSAFPMTYEIDYVRVYQKK